MKMTKIMAIDTLTLPIVETFHSIQGEGRWSGTNAFFIRLGGCDVGCPFCDTKHSWNAKRHPQRSVADLTREAIDANPAIVVITGGEPLLHDLTELTRLLRSSGLRVHLETSGAHPLSGEFDWITLSPKPFKPPQDSIYSHVAELKVVIAKPEDFSWAEQQAQKTPGAAVRSLQPEANTPESTKLVFDYVLAHRDWRISLQTHKLLGVR